ncbi:MAG: protein containing von Willebrand factor type (vWA) domain [Candidatus Eremiobacteraeota bacterium]|nr:protein containing von Willebrand factor type (vWA) domain [Candidatus Eremiobacteraeota bacterium]
MTATVEDRVASFGAALRGVGIAVDTARLAAFVDALRAASDLSPFALYWYARITLLSSVDQLDAFDGAFARVWYEPASSEHEAPTPIQREIAVDDGAGEASSARERRADRVVTAVEAERLRTTDFAAFTQDEWRLARRLMEDLPVAAERRRSRRTALRPRGNRLDLGATVRRDLATFGLRAQRRYRTRRTALRPVVFLCDVSGSMAPYGRALLQYGYVLERARPKVAVFAFATRLTELTRAFARACTQPRFEAVLRGLRDWSGGTSLGGSLRAYNREHAARGEARGATLVIVSDGCERDDPAVLASEIATLARLARRVVWVNPLKRDPAYEPLTRGMRAALPYVDVFLDGHDLRSLAAVARAIGGATTSRPTVRRRTHLGHS